MKVSDILVLFALIVIVKANLMVAILQPVVLSLGAAFAALDVDLDPLIDRMYNLIGPNYEKTEEEL